jgi:hypothetical protein
MHMQCAQRQHHPERPSLHCTYVQVIQTTVHWYACMHSECQQPSASQNAARTTHAMLPALLGLPPHKKPPALLLPLGRRSLGLSRFAPAPMLILVRPAMLGSWTGRQLTAAAGAL